MSTTVGYPEISGWSPGKKRAIIGFHLENPLEGYRRLTFMMLDQDIVAVKSGECMAGVETSGTAVALEG